MKFSEMWVREWVNPPINNNQLINQFNKAGFNIAGSQPISNKCRDIVIGEITECNIHPNLNNVWIVKVNNGNKKLKNIVCNDINCRKNLRVVVANIGTVLPNGQIITPTIVHGQKSEGILCTFSMLKLKNDMEDIIKLPENAPIGCNFYDYLCLNDNIIDINIPPNRGDCLSIIGIAREIAAINQLQLKTLNIKTIQPTITDTISVIIEDPQACPQFLGKILRNIDTTVSTPLNIQARLQHCGIKPTNIVSDVTNYVLLELGHPVYAFDYEKIDQHIIYIRFAKCGEILTLYDNNRSLKLSTKTLIIADHKKPLSIAGIIIGKQSYVSHKTHHILLQSAFFNPKNILGQSKLYNLHTFSSICYERGIDPNISELALNYATSLLLNICNGYSGPTIKIVNHSTLPKPNLITLHRSKLNKILGFHITDQQVTCILNNLGFKVQFQDTVWKVLTPSWRFDISIEENLISEIIRIYGYDNIPQTSANVCLMKNNNKNYIDNISSLSRAKTVLIDRGYHEVITYSFINPNIQNLFYPKKNPLTLINPMNVDMSVMRLSLWPGLIKTVIHNQNRQQKNIQLFESGICFFPTTQENNNKQILQKLMIAGIRSTLKSNEHWYNMESCVDFYDIKGDIEALFKITNKFNNDIMFKNCIHSALHPKKSASIFFKQKIIGYIGMIHPRIQKKLNLYSNTLIFEFVWNEISKFKLPKITNISKFPKNYRDISFIVPMHIMASDVINECKNSNKDQLTDVKLIDVYVGNNILLGHKSFTIQLTLQSKTHTLREQEIALIVNQCTTILNEKFHAILR